MSISGKLSGLPTDNLYKFVALFGLVLIVAGVGWQWSSSSEVAIGRARLAGLQYMRALQEAIVDEERYRVERNLQDIDMLSAYIERLENQKLELSVERQLLLVIENELDERHMVEIKLLESEKAALPVEHQRLREIENELEYLHEETAVLEERLRGIEKQLKERGKEWEDLLNVKPERTAKLEQLESDLTEFEKTLFPEAQDVASKIELAQSAWAPSAFLVLVGSLLSTAGFLLWWLKLQRHLDREAAQLGRTMEPTVEPADKAKEPARQPDVY